MNKKARMLPVVALSSLLLGCSNGPEYGTVENMHITPTYVIYQQSCTGYTSQGYCRGYILIPIIVPEVRYLTLSNETEKGDRSVPSEVWEECSIGDSFNNEVCIKEEG